jgi:ABC-type nickel/cobalt efflux system permease component RcnA
MSAAMDQAGEDAREILLTLYRENSGQARHYEQQRQAIAAASALVAAVVLGFLATREAPIAEGWLSLLCALLLIAVGGTGFVASLTRHERARLHVERVHAVRREISRRFPVDIQMLYDEARRTHARRYPRLSERTGRVHWTYQALHASIAALGIVLAFLALGGGS